MTADPRRHHMTVKEYLELDQSSPDAKYEYIDGIVYNVRDPQSLAGLHIRCTRTAFHITLCISRSEIALVDVYAHVPIDPL